MILLILTTEAHRSQQSSCGGRERNKFLTAQVLCNHQRYIKYRPYHQRSRRGMYHLQEYDFSDRAKFFDLDHHALYTIPSLHSPCGAKPICFALPNKPSTAEAFNYRPMFWFSRPQRGLSTLLFWPVELQG